MSCSFTDLWGREADSLYMLCLELLRISYSVVLCVVCLFVFPCVVYTEAVGSVLADRLNCKEAD